MYHLLRADNGDSDQTAHPRSLIRVSVVRMKKLHHGYQKCAQRRFRSDCANTQSDLNLRWAHTYEGTFPDVSAHLTCNRIYCQFHDIINSLGGSQVSSSTKTDIYQIFIMSY